MQSAFAHAGYFSGSAKYLNQVRTFTEKTFMNQTSTQASSEKGKAGSSPAPHSKHLVTKAGVEAASVRRSTKVHNLPNMHPKKTTTHFGLGMLRVRAIFTGA